MARRRQCPRCGAFNAYTAKECDGCSVIFSHLEREAPASSTAVQLCSWNEHGQTCEYRGIINTSGRWYCREHDRRYSGIEPEGVGNYPTRSVRSAEMCRWDGWYAQWLVRRDRPMPRPEFLNQREPGDDDDPVVP